ncbi:MAG: hypothetical protein F6K58_05025 [Symploca sp. SIO2E9]|nr:hypothetical protein [Symploca sp. SIO2E9]
MRDQIFISYSHQDKEWLIKLQKMLKPLTRQQTIDEVIDNLRIVLIRFLMLTSDYQQANRLI